MKKWIHREFVFGKTLKKDNKISLGDPISLSRRSAAYWQEQETWVPARIPRACVPNERRFHVPASKKNWDSMCLRPKRTEIPLPCVQKELRFHLPTSKKNFYSTCPPPKSTETPTTHVPRRKKSSLQLAEPSPTLVQCQNPPKTFWVATRVLLFCCPRKKGFLFPTKN
jgi:hypothetical protein